MHRNKRRGKPKVFILEMFSETVDRIASNDATLKRADFNDLHLRSTEIIAEALVHNSTVVELNIVNNEINSDGFTPLSNALLLNRSVQKLSLLNNRLRDAGTQKLAHVLMTNTTLTSLNVAFNIIGVDGIRALAHALTRNTSLTRLMVGVNSFGVDGAQAIADMLRQNATLMYLNLVGCQIGPKGAQAIANALIENNSTLTSLDISNNMIEMQGLEAFAYVLMRNSTLSWLSISDNVRENDYDVFQGPLSQNSTIIYFFPLMRAIAPYVTRNQRAHARADEAIAALEELDILKVPSPQRRAGARTTDSNDVLRRMAYEADRGLSRSFFAQMVRELKKTRNDKRWWTDAERREAGLESASSSKRRVIESCIQCEVGEPRFHEKGSPDRLFCGSYCQWLQHTGAPDLRGKSPAEIVALFAAVAGEKKNTSSIKAL